MVPDSLLARVSGIEIDWRINCQDRCWRNLLQLCRQGLSMGLMYRDGGGMKSVVLRWHRHTNFLSRKGIGHWIPNGELFGHLDFQSVYRFSCGLQLISDT
ncbi:hypothetical protein V6N11_071772 [Hibiscus sabdariffa]|uniref:Uncharacterized protein n=1 Tax=Hibiscus sabdariffa TaxID=183260 RepID=A0ABR2U1A7_9ROSI